MTKEEYNEKMEKYQSYFADTQFLLEVQCTRFDEENKYCMVVAKTGYELYKAVEATKEQYECPYVYVIGRFNGSFMDDAKLISACRAVCARRHNVDKVIEDFGGVRL